MRVVRELTVPAAGRAARRRRPHRPGGAAAAATPFRVQLRRAVEGRWEDVTCRELLDRGHGAGQGPGRGRGGPRRPGRHHVPDPRTSGRSPTSRSGSPARSRCRSTRRRRPSRSPGSSATPAPSAASSRPRAHAEPAGVAARGGCPDCGTSGRSTTARSTSWPAPAPGVADERGRPSAAPPCARTRSPRSSTRPGRPAGPRAACSRTGTCAPGPRTRWPG